jgi:hypothetical protein
MTELCYPSVETWFICWDENRTEIKSYGGILTTQCMDSPWVEVDYYIGEAGWLEWLEILLANGIDPSN